jgi:precorrin-6A/cobalt-precorrin-6A reductase
MDISYIRYERKKIDLTNYPTEYILSVDSYDEAVDKAEKYKTIFLTIGSNNLIYFTKEIENWENRLVARILPDWKVIKKTREMGFTPANLLAMQGPFSFRLNRLLLKEYKADVMVSKASGNIGGLDTKIKAAIDHDIPAIIIKRPNFEYPIVFNDIDELISHCLR